MTGSPRDTQSFYDAMREQIQATPMPTPGRLRSLQSFLARGVRRGRLGVLTSVGALAAAAIIIVVLVNAGTQPARADAYTLRHNPDGTITVTLNDVATAIPQLNAKFVQLGIQETVIPITANCHATGGPPGAQADPYATIGPGSMSTSFTYSKHDRPAPRGFKYVLAAKQLPDARIETWIGAIKPPLPPCFANAPQQ